MEYLEDIKIDERALDTEWLQQPRLVFLYSELTAKNKKRLDLANEKLSILRAELDKKIRTTPDKYGIEKITETAVSNAILTQDEYKEMQREIIEIKYDYDIARAASNAMDSKKSALENLVKLHGQNYFAGPQVPRDLSKEWMEKERSKMSNTKVGRALKRGQNMIKIIALILLVLIAPFLLYFVVGLVTRAIIDTIETKNKKKNDNKN